MTIPSSAGAATPARAPRWPAIDAARGAAIIAMVVYHFTWDLSFYRIIATDVARHAGWSLFAGAIAASFLALVGAGFALGAREGFDWTRWLRRLGLIAGAALLVTLATLVAMPHAPVLFGILHCIAAASVLILPFLRAPAIVAAAAAAIVFALPPLARSAAFDGPWLTWLGLNETPLAAVDHVPLLPWFGYTLAGYALARFVIESESAAPLRARIAAWRAESAPARWLVAAGRWSLVIYLTHQLALMAALWPFAPAPRAPDEAAGFRAACEQGCRGRGADAEACQRFCGCAIEKLRPSPAWSAILRDQVGEKEQSLIAETTRQCAPSADAN